MKRTFLFAFFLSFISATGYCDNLSLQAKIDSIYKQIMDYKTAKKTDSLDFFNDNLADFLISSKDDIDIFKVHIGNTNAAAAQNKKFCLISWNTQQGGTMYAPATVVIWKDKSNIIQAKKLRYRDYNNSILDPKGKEEDGLLYESVVNITLRDTVFYLCSGFNTYSSQGYDAELNVFYIKGDYPDFGKIIKVDKIIDSGLGTEFEFKYIEDPKKPGTYKHPTITYNKKTRTIVVPELNDNNKLVYKFYSLKGNTFLRVKH